jgi:hypothetical protein
MKRALLFVLVLGFASTAFAQSYAQKGFGDRAERGMVADTGKGQAGIAFDGSMMKGGDTFKPGFLSLYGAYAPIDKLEVGLWFPIQLLKPEGAKMFNSVGPIYAEYQFMDFLAARLGFNIPFEPKFEAKSIELQLDVIAKYKVQDTLAIVGGAGIHSGITFDKKYAMRYIPIQVGAQYTFIPDFWGQLLTGYCYNLDSSDFNSIPLHVKVGYTLQGNMDLALSFSLLNLAPKSGGAMDSKSLGFTFAYLF